MLTIKSLYTKLLPFDFLKLDYLTRGAVGQTTSTHYFVYHSRSERAEYNYNFVLGKETPCLVEIVHAGFVMYVHTNLVF